MMKYRIQMTLTVALMSITHAFVIFLVKVATVAHRIARTLRLSDSEDFENGRDCMNLNLNFPISSSARPVS